jgi:hypothetical protein
LKTPPGICVGQKRWNMWELFTVSKFDNDRSTRRLGEAMSGEADNANKEHAAGMLGRRLAQLRWMANSGHFSNRKLNRKAPTPRDRGTGAQAAVGKVPGIAAHWSERYRG